VSELKLKIGAYNNAQQLKNLGMSFAQKLKNSEDYHFFARLK